MQKFNDENGASIVLFNAPNKDEAKRIRRHLLEKRLIRGGFIVDIEPGFLDEEGKIVEEDEYYVVFSHTSKELTGKVIEEIENNSKSKAMSWDLKEGSDNYMDWIAELKLL